MQLLSSPRGSPLGIPTKIALIENNRKRAGGDTNHRTPRALSFYFSPAFPQYKEASGEERDATAGKNYSEFRNGGLKFEF